MTSKTLRDLIGNVSLHDVSGYRPGVLIYGLTREQLGELFTLAQIELSREELRVLQSQNEPGT